jgi:segregation and condensation protein B
MNETNQTDEDEETGPEAGETASEEASGAPSRDDAPPLDPEAWAQARRLVEAMLFASPEPLTIDEMATLLPEGTDIGAIVGELVGEYRDRGVNLVQIAGGWTFRTAADLGDALKLEKQVSRKLSRAAIESLAIIAYHQPITRAEIEEIRGVAISKGTLDTLLEAGWIQPRGRRRTPGRPVTWGTSHAFLAHFGLNSLSDLPGVEDLKAMGLLDARPAITLFREQANPETPPGGGVTAVDEDEERLEEIAEPLPDDDDGETPA